MRILIPAAAALALTACGDKASLPITAGYGPNPTLVAPNKTLLPTIKVAKVERWAAGAAPTPAAGLAVARFADGLDHPRWLYTLPNGDVLVAESNAPERPDENKGIKGWVQKIIMGRAGATVPSANRITLLRDADGDGRAEVRTVFLRGLNSPFGMVLVGSDLYVANTDAVVRFAYTPGATMIATPGVKFASLPAGPRNHHWTKNIIASADGRTLYATVGSNSNVAENGLNEEVDRAAILAIERATGATSLFASGLRNPNGLAWNPVSGALWTTVNERDEIGSDIVPDYMTSVKAGGFYGWPYSYYGQTVDARVEPARPDLVAKALRPDYALGAHTASLGLAFSNAAAALPASYASGAFVGQHGSWNRNPPSGYKVLFVPFAGAMPQGMPREVLTGFLGPDGQAFGRPVGVAIDKRGALLVADDVGNVIWRVTGAVQTATR